MKHFFLLSLLLLQADFFAAKSYTYYLEFKAAPSTAEIENLKASYPIESIQLFYKRHGEYWQRYFEVTSKSSSLDKTLETNSLFARVEKPVAATVLSLEPSQNGEAASLDTFIRYQWALDNSGQTVYSATDDNHPEILTSKVGLDIQWKALQPLLKKQLRRPVIAVVDSGLSYTHDQMVHAVAKNEIECKNGNRIVGAEEDKDGNGFPGDCMGWNFTTDNKQRRNDILDDIGHGTHISGIIAAKTDDVGISGVWDQIQILPLKVYSDSKASDEAPFIQRVAKAILYATDRKVDVINLSLGWPLFADLPVIRNAMNEALKANITIVAGAGNDGHSAKVLPCSYEGVICVGATSLDGSLPGFTNYGGQVDIMAPGQSILSLLPPLLQSKMFGLRKYDIMNGTSQATPFVSATAAVLKAYYPNITNNEILARLRLSANMKDLIWGNKFAGSGTLQAADAIKVAAQSYVAPVFKDISLFHVNPSSGNVSISLPIKNYWKASGIVKVRIQSDRLEFQKSDFIISNLAEGQTQTLKILAKLPDLSTEHTSRLLVEITADSKTTVFTHESFFSITPDAVEYRDFRVDAKNPIRSVYDYEIKNQNAAFYSVEKLDKSLKLEVLEASQNKIEVKASIALPKAIGIYPQIGVTRVDLNYDGQYDYFITAVLQDDEQQYIEHYALDKNLKPLFGKYSTWKFEDEGVTIEQTTLPFASFQSPEMGKIRVPVFINQTVVPSTDRNPDPFDATDLDGRGIYVLQPTLDKDGILLKTRLANNYARNAEISNKFGLRHNERVKLLYHDIKNENIVGLFAAGLGSEQQYGFVEFDTNDFSILSIKKLPIKDLDLRYQVSRKINDTTLAFFGIFRVNFAILSLIDLPSGKIKTYEIETDQLKNGVVSLLAVNIKDGLVEAFVESVDSLLLFSFSENGRSVSATPIYRFSYLPGQFFTDTLTPIQLKDDSMGIYVDSSAINVRNVHTWLSDGELRAPIKYSTQLPAGCMALNPRKLLANESEPSYQFLCKKDDGFILRQIPLK